MSITKLLLQIPNLDTPLSDQQTQLLLEMPFDPSLLSWKPQTVRENRCLPVVYVDARDVMDRLNWVVGPGNWETRYSPFFEKSCVQCDLMVRYPTGKVVTRSDVGSFSDQPDTGDKAKAAYSDSLKRAAVQFGVGSYFYGLKADWVDFDQQKKRIPERAIEMLHKNLPEFAKPSPLFAKRFKFINYLQKIGILGALGGYKILLLEEVKYNELLEEVKKIHGEIKNG